MKAICITAKREWNYLLKYKNLNIEDCNSYPYGEYFIENQILFFRTGVRKTNSAGAVQYMICKFDIDTLILIGTCGGIDRKNHMLDIIIPNKVVQWDCTIPDYEPIFKEMFVTNINLDNLNFEYKTGLLATGDRAIVRLEEYNLLNDIQVTIADTEAGAIAYVCNKNNIKFIVIKGISDFPNIEKEAIDSDKEQTDNFIQNIPLIMKDILENYISKILKLI